MTFWLVVLAAFVGTLLAHVFAFIAGVTISGILAVFANRKHEREIVRRYVAEHPELK